MARKREVVYYNGRLQGKYLDEDMCDRLENLRKLDQEQGYVKELKNIIYDLPASDVEAIKDMRDNEVVDFEGKTGELSNLQTIGVAYMFFAKRLVLGDSVGIGKTVEVCGLLNLLESRSMKLGQDFRFLFLTGKNLVAQAKDELIRFTGNYVQDVYGEKSKVDKFVMDNYSELKYSVVGTHSLIKSVAFQEYMRGFVEDSGSNPFDILIIDESGDILSNSNTQMYKDASFLAKMFDRVVLLNATAFESELRSFYNQLNFVDDSFLPTKTEFSKTYEIFNYGVGPYPMFSGKYKNQNQFRQLVGYRYFARTRKGSGARMVDCSAEAVIVPTSKEQRWLLKQVSMPQMVYDCPAYFNMGVENSIETVPKMGALLKLITEDLVMEPSILIFARFKEAQRSIKELLEMYGIDSEIMNGDTSQKDREAIINRFKLGDIRVLITNVQKGLNFGNCNICIFYTYDPNPNKMVQFEGRMTRSFDIVNKHVYVLLSRGGELRTFNTIIADRARASDMFAGSDFSCVMQLLLEKYKDGKIK